MITSDFYFFHIPKTAGMSVWKAIEAACEPSSICPCWLWDQLIELPRMELSRYRIFRGHFYGFLEPYLGRELPKFTILRDPLERTISYYCYIRSLPEHPAYSLARTLTLREFCLHNDSRYLIENYQAGYLASFVFPKDPAELAASFTPELRRRHLFQAMLEPRTRDMDPGLLLTAARRGFERFVAVGTSERLAVSMRLIGQSLGLPFSLPSSKENVTTSRISADHLDSATIRTIHNLTAVDRALYLEASERLDSVFAERCSDEH